MKTPEEPIAERIYSYQPSAHKYSIGVKDMKATFLTCEYETEHGAWHITDFSVEDEGKGIGKKLVQRLAQNLGPNQHVYSEVPMEETLEVIRQLGLDTEAKKGSLLIKERDILNQLKSVRVMEGGGIKTEYCKLEWVPLITLGFNKREIQDFQDTQNPNVDGDLFFTVEWHGIT